MNARALVLAVSFVAGLLFSVGLGIGGMLHPPKVIGFLDFFGRWDPSLLFVMGGGVVVSFLFTRLALGRPHPFFDLRFHLPSATKVDGPLVVGAALFGIGWALAGYCPGPAIVATTTLASDALLFFGVMAVSMLAFRLVKAARGSA